MTKIISLKPSKVYIFWLLIFFNLTCNAENNIITLNTMLSGKVLRVTPSLQFKTSAEIKEAVDNGIRINIIAKAQLYQPHRFWFDNIIATDKVHLEVSYFTLSKLYVAKNLTTGKQQAFNNYHQLWSDIEKIIAFNFPRQKDTNIWVKSRIVLDKAALPTAMQLPVLFNANWDIDTPWYKQLIGTK